MPYFSHIQGARQNMLQNINFINLSYPKVPLTTDYRRMEMQLCDASSAQIPQIFRCAWLLQIVELDYAFIGHPWFVALTIESQKFK